MRNPDHYLAPTLEIKGAPTLSVDYIMAQATEEVPEYGLWYAMIERVITGIVNLSHDIFEQMDNETTTQSTQYKARLKYADACKDAGWLFTPERPGHRRKDDMRFTLEDCCTILGLDPDHVRRIARGRIRQAGWTFDD